MWQRDKKYPNTSVNGELSQLNGKITKMRTALMQVARTRDRLQAAANLSSPLRRLPPELLQVIFVCCLPLHRNAVMHSSEALVLLGRICSEWRRISLSTPEVWSSLRIVPPNVNFSNLTSSTARFKRELIEMCPSSGLLVIQRMKSSYVPVYWKRWFRLWEVAHVDGQPDTVGYWCCG